jgi:hypothetical protein
MEHAMTLLNGGVTEIRFSDVLHDGISALTMLHDLVEVAPQCLH